jgi:protein MAK11
LLAIGGFKEVVKIYNLGKKIEQGELMHHDGSISALEFYKKSFFISAAQDGKIIIWRVKDWSYLHALKLRE